jgi:hypothetical protein
VDFHENLEENCFIGREQLPARDTGEKKMSIYRMLKSDFLKGSVQRARVWVEAKKEFIVIEGTVIAVNQNCTVTLRLSTGETYAANAAQMLSPKI